MQAWVAWRLVKEEQRMLLQRLSTSVSLVQHFPQPAWHLLGLNLRLRV